MSSPFRISMKESKFQSDLIKEIKKTFPGCVVLKNDPKYIQGFPDLTILYGERWAVLECKKSRSESHQPNQDYYVMRLNEMGFSRFIYPENKEAVLRELKLAFQQARQSQGKACVSEP